MSKSNYTLSRRTLGAGLGLSVLGGCGTSVDDYARAAAHLRRPLEADSTDPLPELVRFATLAANGHNTQPWRFLRTPAGVDITPDVARRTPVVDPDDHHTFVSLGAAAENLLISAPAMARTGSLAFDATHSRISIALEASVTGLDPLMAAIPRRQCTRSEYDARSPSTEVLSLIQAAAQVDGVELRMLTTRPEIDAVRDYVVEGNRVQMSDPAFVRELKDWIRFNPAAAIATGDGLHSASSGNPTLPDWIAGVMFDAAFTIESETEKYVKQMNTSAGVAVFIGANATPADWIKVGRAYQRFALQATLLDIKHAFVNQPVESPAVRAQFATHLGIDNRRPDLVVRFGYAPHLPFSLRRPVSEVLSP